MNRLPNVTIQIVPPRSPATSPRGIGPVTLLRFPAEQLLPDCPTVVYLERLLADAQYLTKPNEVQPYLHLASTRPPRRPARPLPRRATSCGGAPRPSRTCPRRDAERPGSPRSSPWSRSLRASAPRRLYVRSIRTAATSTRISRWRRSSARAPCWTGCGTGVFALLLAERGITVTGIDPARGLRRRRARQAGRRAGAPARGDAGDPAALRADLATMTGNVAQAIVDPPAWHGRRCAARTRRCGPAGGSSSRRATRHGGCGEGVGAVDARDHLPRHRPPRASARSRPGPS